MLRCCGLGTPLGKHRGLQECGEDASEWWPAGPA